MTRSMLPLVLIAGLVATARADSETDTEIHALIQAVAESDCEFNRNGSVYSAEAAAEHGALLEAQVRSSPISVDLI